MNKRIRDLRKALDLSQADFADRIGLKQNAISYMEKTGATVTEQNIKTICSQFCVNENWLRKGIGKMFVDDIKKQREFFDIFNELSPILQEYLFKTAADLLEVQFKMMEEKDSLNKIPPLNEEQEDEDSTDSNDETTEFSYVASSGEYGRMTVNKKKFKEDLKKLIPSNEDI